MERDNLILIALGVIIAINLGLWYYTYTTNAALLGTLEAGLQSANTSIVGMQRDYDIRINQHTVRLNLLDQDLDTQTEGLRKNITGTADQLNSNLAQMKQQSEQKLSKLENQLLNIDVQSADFSNVISEAIQSVVSIRTSGGGGSGWVVDSRGYIVTNYHVVSGTSEVEVVTYKRGSYTGKVIGYDAIHDVAVIKISDSMPATKFADSSNVQVGQKVVAFGSPAGLDFTVTEGIVSAYRKDSRGVEFFQIDVPINPGNSGGPLISSKGRVVGITQSKNTELEGIGFAIAANSVENIVEGIIEKDAGTS